ncbi:MAG: hypothetical protein AAF360_19545, partial [Pseudomonadota bacterium]
MAPAWFLGDLLRRNYEAVQIFSLMAAFAAICIAYYVYVFVHLHLNEKAEAIEQDVVATQFESLRLLHGVTTYVAADTGSFQALGADSPASLKDLHAMVASFRRRWPKL